MSGKADGGRKKDFVPGALGETAKEVSGTLETKLYLMKFGKSLADQMEVVASEADFDSETMRDEFEDLINNINNLSEDNAQYYIVETAQLACSRQLDDVQTLLCKKGEITSILKVDVKNEEEEAESLSQLRIPEERSVIYGTRKPAVVTDAKGGLRDEIQSEIQGNKRWEGLNVISFGNCPYMQENPELGSLAQKLYDSIPVPERNVSAFEIEEKMTEAIEQGYGTCYCCMDLESEWENLPAGFCVDNGNFYCESSNKESTQQVDDIEEINMMSMLFCRRGGIITALTSGQKQIQEQIVYEQEEYREYFIYIDKDGNEKCVEWTISNEEFRDCNALTKEEIEKICSSHNTELVEKGFAEVIYYYCKDKKLNPKVLLSTLGQEQSWCKGGNYEKAFGVGAGGNPESFASSDEGIAKAGNIYIEKYEEGIKLEVMTVVVNKDAPNYNETKAVKGDKFSEWENANSQYIEYMKDGQEVECINAAMYAKLCYTPWVDFPPQGSHPLEDWLKIYNSLEDCLGDE